MTSETSIHCFHSIHQLYAVGPNGLSDLQLRLTRYGDNSVEIELENRRFLTQRLTQIKKLLTLCILYGAYNAFARTMGEQAHQIHGYRCVHIAFIVWLLYICTSTLSLIKSERLLFCRDFALQLQTERFLARRSNLFISTTNIRDIVINEVIEDLDIHYILIVRTKGSLFKQRPIIPIFNCLRPSIDCLELIYKDLKKCTDA